MEPQLEKKLTDFTTHLRELLECAQFRCRHRVETKNFTRNRKLRFSDVARILLNLPKRALQDELDEYYRVLSGDLIASREVSKSAFSQARQKLRASAFVELNRSQLNYFYEDDLYRQSGH